MSMVDTRQATNDFIANVYDGVFVSHYPKHYDKPYSLEIAQKDSEYFREYAKSDLCKILMAIR